MIVPEVVVQFFSSILSSLQMREVESTFPAWLMSEAAIGWTQTSLGITALSLIPARGLKMLAWKSLTWVKAMTEFIAVVSILKPHKPELQGSTWLLWVSYKISFLWFWWSWWPFFKKTATIFCPKFDALAFQQKISFHKLGRLPLFSPSWIEVNSKDPDTHFKVPFLLYPLGICSTTAEGSIEHNSRHFGHLSWTQWAE